MNDPVVILGARRTPIGKFGGSLAGLSAAELGSAAARACLSSVEIDPKVVDSVIFGHARQAGGGPNVARQIVKRAGLSDTVPAYTVNQACASGLRALINGVQAIQTGESEVALAGGTESMSNTPYLLPRARFGYKAGHEQVVDAMYKDGFLCPLCGILMGQTAEVLAREYKISRKEQDEYALESQRRWKVADAEGRFDRERVAIDVEERKLKRTISQDEHPRPETTMDSLSKLPPVFETDGSVHAGNASGITDGAAAFLLMRESKAKAFQLDPMARIGAYETVGVDPRRMGIGPVDAVRKLLSRTHLKLKDIDVVELNEAFAVQVLACAKELDLDLERTNRNGGAIALGHPIGATGARIATTLLHTMEAQRAQKGIATLCVSGGMGMAVLFER